jgi:hypothetical protein
LAEIGQAIRQAHAAARSTANAEQGQ